MRFSLTVPPVPHLTSPAPVQSFETPMFSSLRPAPSLRRQTRLRGPHHIKQAILGPNDLSRSNSGYRRPLSSSHFGQADSQRPPKSSASSVPRLLGVALASALLGFGLATSSVFESNASGVSANTKFGSPEDIEKAIQELRTVLAGAQVSTDPGDVQVHGFSTNDHHQGFFHFLPTGC